MLVNGQPVKNDAKGLLDQLSSLNSSFPNYVGTKTFPPLPNNAVGAYNYGVQLLNQGYHRQAIEQFSFAEKQLTTNPSNNIFLADINTNMAISYQASGNFGEAEQRFKKSIALATDSKEYFRVENFHKNLANLHRANGTLAQYETANNAALTKSQQTNDQTGELQARFALGATSRLTGNNKEAVAQYSKAYDLQQGKVDYNAHRVEQHEVGFSNKEKIGTDNIQQCVAVILHDPVTKKTALAHVDKFTDASSLSDVIKQFPPGTKLNAYLVGGRDRSPGSKEVSDENIRKVSTELQKHSSVNVKAADVGDKGAPSGIVFDPQTGKLEHAVPGKHHETTPERKLLLNVTPKLNFAFDFTQSRAINAVKLNDQQKERVVVDHLLSKLMGSETWSANILMEPRSIVAKKIAKTDPQIVTSAVNKYVEQKLSEKFGGQRVDKNQIDKERANLVKTAMESLRTDDKPLVVQSKNQPIISTPSMARPVANPSMARPVANQVGIKVSKPPFPSKEMNFLDKIDNTIKKVIQKVTAWIDGVAKTYSKKENIPQHSAATIPQAKAKETISNDKNNPSKKVQNFVTKFRENNDRQPTALHTPQVINKHVQKQDKSQKR